MRWTGTLLPSQSGAHKIITQSDDGIRVWIDGKLVIDDFTGHYVTRDESTVDLRAGVPVSIRVDYFQLDAGASARLLWSSAGLAEEITLFVESRASVNAAPKASPARRSLSRRPAIDLELRAA